ncbi:MAG: ribonuclease HI family protein [Granulicatella adiacens]|nr:ribonuclease HI family protein [Granulicatella adiacens]
MIKVFTDAAVNGNPGDVGLGVLVLKDGEQLPFKISVEEKMDNHLAEFTAINWALGWLLEEGYQEELIFMHTDSKVTADAISKRYTKKESNRIILKEIQNKLKDFSQLFVKWIPESENKGADQLARQALQQTIGK